MALTSEETKKQAIDQIFAKFGEAEVGITPGTKILVTELVHKIPALGKHESRYDVMSEQAQVTVERMLDDNPGLKGVAFDICEILENLAPTPAAKQVLQETFLSVKADIVQEKKKLEAAEALDVAQGMMDEIAGHPTIRSNIGDAHADKIGSMIKTMNEKLDGVDNLRDRAEIMLKSMQEVDKYLENAGKQAGKSELGKVSNLVKAGLKVVCTLGMNKSAKLEFASAKFAMDNVNASRLKGEAEITSSRIKTVTRQAKEKSSGMER